MEANTAIASKITKDKARKLALALYNSKYNEAHVLNVLQSDGFSKEEAVEISFKAYGEIHEKVKRTSMIFIWVFASIAIIFFLVGFFYDFNSFVTPEAWVRNPAADQLLINQGTPIPVQDLTPQRNYVKNTLCIAAAVALVFLLSVSLARYFFRELPLYKKLSKPVELFNRHTVTTRKPGRRR